MFGVCERCVAPAGPSAHVVFKNTGGVARLMQDFVVWGVRAVRGSGRSIGTCYLKITVGDRFRCKLSLFGRGAGSAILCCTVGLWAKHSFWQVEALAWKTSGFSALESEQHHGIYGYG